MLHGEADRQQFFTFGGGSRLNMDYFSWPEQWREVNPTDSPGLVRQLASEITTGHILFRAYPIWNSVCAISRREDCNDVLFSLVGSLQVAEVHLVWGGKSSSPDWPRTVIYQNLSDWREKYIGD